MAILFQHKNIKKNLPCTKAEDETKQRNESINNEMNLNTVTATDYLSEGVYILYRELSSQNNNDEDYKKKKMRKKMKRKKEEKAKN